MDDFKCSFHITGTEVRACNTHDELKALVDRYLQFARQSLMSRVVEEYPEFMGSHAPRVSGALKL